MPSARSHWRIFLLALALVCPACKETKDGGREVTSRLPTNGSGYMGTTWPTALAAAGNDFIVVGRDKNSGFLATYVPGTGVSPPFFTTAALGSQGAYPGVTILPDGTGIAAGYVVDGEGSRLLVTRFDAGNGVILEHHKGAVGSGAALAVSSHEGNVWALTSVGAGSFALAAVTVPPSGTMQVTHYSPVGLAAGSVPVDLAVGPSGKAFVLVTNDDSATGKTFDVYAFQNGAANNSFGVNGVLRVQSSGIGLMPGSIVWGRTYSTLNEADEDLLALAGTVHKNGKDQGALWSIIGTAGSGAGRTDFENFTNFRNAVGMSQTGQFWRGWAVGVSPLGKVTVLSVAYMGFFRQREEYGTAGDGSGTTPLSLPGGSTPGQLAKAAVNPVDQVFATSGTYLSLEGGGVFNRGVDINGTPLEP